MAQHGGTPSADSLECLTRLTEGWAAGIRLAAMSMDTHPDPDRAPSDGPNMIPLKDLPGLLRLLMDFDRLAKAPAR